MDNDRWDEFLKARYDGGKKKVPNPNPDTKNTYPQVTLSTALKFEVGGKFPVYEKVKQEYAQWLSSEGDKPQGSKKKQKSGPDFLRVKQDKDRLEKRNITIHAEKLEDLEITPAVRYHLGTTKNRIARNLAKLVGAEALQDCEVSIDTAETVGDYTAEFDISVKGPHIEKMTRSIYITPRRKGAIIYNNTLRLKDNAPEGLGGRIVANQVISAIRSGFDELQCEAYRIDKRYRDVIEEEHNKWVGYLVWPKMGYDGSADNALSSSEELRSAVEKYYPDKDDIMVSDILSMPNGSDLWEKHGESFEATFDLKKDSASVKILREYLKRKAQKLNSTVESLVRVAKIHAL